MYHIHIFAVLGIYLCIVQAVSAYGILSEVVNESNFCVYLPPKDSENRNIADTERHAQAYCIGNTPNATDAGRLEDGFIVTANFVQTNDYVQVTGKMNPHKMRLNPMDEGGQMDVKMPSGSKCVGWKYYVNLIEPSSHIYCMRCCNDELLCNRGISERGCENIIPGKYPVVNAAGASIASPPSQQWRNKKRGLPNPFFSKNGAMHLDAMLPLIMQVILGLVLIVAS